MLQTYFLTCLRAFGFDASAHEVNFSVGFCQGDYVSFTGRIDFDTMQRLFKKKEGIDIGPESECYQLGSDDFNSMMILLRDFGTNDLSVVEIGRSLYVESTDDIEAIFDYDYQGIIATYNDTIPWEVNRRWQLSWQSFLDWLQEEVRSLCDRMLADAHQIQMAGSLGEQVVRSLTIGRYIVQVREEWQCNIGIGNYDGDELRSLFSGFISQKLMYRDVYGIVVDSDAKRVLGRSMSHTYVGSSDALNPDYLKLQRSVASEAIADTRHLLERHAEMV
ncbi:hypothetical protein EGT81_19235 [Alcaligenes faecalis]|uniref:hypothetical protein n=1 Tax=Alcaligenes faecalis TaxID=511 RepID=UPI000F65D40E|nr:hypothetical protein [Alcaligenes faecalis]RSE57573.1 hypothetical protein EGT81_19235 [Alcaligenes faecalis]